MGSLPSCSLTLVARPTQCLQVTQLVLKLGCLSQLHLVVYFPAGLLVAADTDRVVSQETQGEFTPGPIVATLV